MNRGIGALLIFGIIAGCQPTISPELPAGEIEREEQRRLAMADFEPLEILAARGLEVQRVDFLYELFGYPSVELVRTPEGEVTLRLNYLGHTDTAVVEPVVWERLQAMADGGALSPPDQREERRRRRRIFRCHAWHTVETLIAGRRQRLVPTPCLGDLYERSLAYVDAVGRAAVEHLPRCAPFRSAPTDDALLNCGRTFGPQTDEYRALRAREG